LTTTAITYQAIRDLAYFQEQYDRLTEEIQQARVQLNSSPPLPATDPQHSKRTEWRSWLELQIKSKCKERDTFVRDICDKGFVISNLPD